MGPGALLFVLLFSVRSHTRLGGVHAVVSEVVSARIQYSAVVPTATARLYSYSCNSRAPVEGRVLVSSNEAVNT